MADSIQLDGMHTAALQRATYYAMWMPSRAEALLLRSCCDSAVMVLHGVCSIACKLHVPFVFLA